MATSAVRSTFEKSTQSFNAHDIDAFAETMTKDVTTRAPGDLDLRGKLAVSGFYRTWLEAFPDARVDIESAHVLEDAVIEEGVFSGTHRAPLRSPAGDLPPTGSAVCVRFIQVMRFRGDKIASLHLMYDRAELAEQLGLAPPSEEAPYGRPILTTPEAIPPH